MPLRILLAALKWSVALASLGGLFYLAYTVHATMQHERGAEATDENSEALKRFAQGRIKLGAELARSHGLEAKAAQAVSWAERVPVYGRVVPNLRASSELRAAFAGTLRAGETPWPLPGSWVQAGKVLGWLDIRVGPQDRLDLQVKLGDARQKQKGAEEVLRLVQERVDRLKTTSQAGGVSQGFVDEALVKLAEARTQLATARDAVTRLEGALAEIDRHTQPQSSTWSSPLQAPTDGEVTELAARPGMAVEAGGLVARLVDFRRPLVRLDLPPEVLSAGPPRDVELFPTSILTPPLRGPGHRPEAGGSPPAVPARLLGVAPQVDAALQYAGYLYEVETPSHLPPEAPGPGGFVWRPGLLVKAAVKDSGAEPRAAVAVPWTALLYHQGRALVYVELSPGRYERREIQVLGRDGDHAVLGDGVTAGEPVVHKQAQVLLSEEFKGDVDND
jgi:hypothetical protein